MRWQHAAVAHSTSSGRQSSPAKSARSAGGHHHSLWHHGCGGEGGGRYRGTEAAPGQGVRGEGRREMGKWEAHTLGRDTGDGEREKWRGEREEEDALGARTSTGKWKGEHAHQRTRERRCMHARPRLRRSLPTGPLDQPAGEAEAQAAHREQAAPSRGEAGTTAAGGGSYGGFSLYRDPSGQDSESPGSPPRGGPRQREFPSTDQRRPSSGHPAEQRPGHNQRGRRSPAALASRKARRATRISERRVE